MRQTSSEVWLVFFCFCFFCFFVFLDCVFQILIGWAGKVRSHGHHGNLTNISIPYCADHYSNLAASYDEHWQTIHDAMKRICLDGLNLQQDDILLDLGSGTGMLSHQVWKAATLKNSVWCVDPSSAMAEKAGKLEGLKPILSTAEDFFAQPHSVSFDKVMCVSAVHHFREPLRVLQGLKESLSTEGLFLIVTRPPNTPLPFFRAALDVFATSLAGDVLLSLITDAGLQASVSTVPVTFHYPKSQWYEMLRGRFMSCLDPFSDEEIEQGIEELEEERFKGVGQDDIIVVRDPCTVFAIRKQ